MWNLPESHHPVTSSHDSMDYSPVVILLLLTLSWPHLPVLFLAPLSQPDCSPCAVEERVSSAVLLKMFAECFCERGKEEERCVDWF